MSGSNRPEPASASASSPSPATAIAKPFARRPFSRNDATGPRLPRSGSGSSQRLLRARRRLLGRDHEGEGVARSRPAFDLDPPAVRVGDCLLALWRHRLHGIGALRQQRRGGRGDRPWPDQENGRLPAARWSPPPPHVPRACHARGLPGGSENTLSLALRRSPQHAGGRVKPLAARPTPADPGPRGVRWGECLLA